MAVTSGAISATTFIPKLWEASVLKAYDKKLVAKEICAMNVSAKIESYGDTVHFPGLVDPSIRDYVPFNYNAGSSPLVGAEDQPSGVSYDNIESTDAVLTIDRAKYFGFKVDDILKAQAQIGVQGHMTERAGYQLRDECDQYLFKLFADGVADGSITSVISGDSTDPLTITANNVLVAIGEMAVKLDEKNIPLEERFIVIPPWMKLKLMLAGVKFQIKNGDSVKNGVEWTDSFGFDLYVSNNLKPEMSDDATPVKLWDNIVGGSKKATAYASQITKTEAIRLETDFGYGVRGLHLYGAKIIRPELIVVGEFKEGEDSTLVGAQAVTIDTGSGG